MPAALRLCLDTAALSANIMIGLKCDPSLFCWTTSCFIRKHITCKDSSSLRYLITAPLSLHLDAVETVVLQLFGFTEEVTVYVFLKTSMAPDHVVLAREVVTLNAQNHHQDAAKVRVRHDTQR